MTGKKKKVVWCFWAEVSLTVAALCCFLPRGWITSTKVALSTCPLDTARADGGWAQNGLTVWVCVWVCGTHFVGTTHFQIRNKLYTSQLKTNNKDNVTIFGCNLLDLCGINLNLSLCESLKLSTSCWELHSWLKFPLRHIHIYIYILSELLMDIIANSTSSWIFSSSRFTIASLPAAKRESTTFCRQSTSTNVWNNAVCRTPNPSTVGNRSLHFGFL